MMKIMGGIDLSKRVDEEQLDELATNLEKFADMYWHNIYFIDDEEEVDAYQKLRHIIFLLKTKQYNELFDDTTIIMTKSEMDLYN